jgi:hypothetical protein
MALLWLLCTGPARQSSGLMCGGGGARWHTASATDAGVMCWPNRCHLTVPTHEIFCHDTDRRTAEAAATAAAVSASGAAASGSSGASSGSGSSKELSMVRSPLLPAALSGAQRHLRHPCHLVAPPPCRHPAATLPPPCQQLLGSTVAAAAAQLSGTAVRCLDNAVRQLVHPRVCAI